jgi:hypothetical protein
MFLNVTEAQKATDVVMEAIFAKAGPVIFPGRMSLSELTSFQLGLLHDMATAAMVATFYQSKEADDSRGQTQAQVQPETQTDETLRVGADGFLLNGEILRQAELIIGKQNFHGSND